MPDLHAEFCTLSPKLEHLVHVLEWVRIEEFVQEGYSPLGRPANDHACLANAFVAKSVLNLPTTTALIERLMIDRTLRRVFGFALH